MAGDRLPCLCGLHGDKGVQGSVRSAADRGRAPDHRHHVCRGGPLAVPPSPHLGRRGGAVGAGGPHPRTRTAHRARARRQRPTPGEWGSSVRRPRNSSAAVHHPRLIRSLSPPESVATGRPSRSAWSLALVAFLALIAWAWVVAPVATGSRTFFFRDVFTTHLPLKAFGAQELNAGRIPAINPTWGLGQPFRGNPNALPFYPGNLLYLVLPFWSAFNLHYGLHWLLAALTMAYLARILGLGWTGALIAALTY